MERRASRTTVRRAARVIGGLLLALSAALATTANASAAEQATAHGAAMAPSASCTFGDIDINYTATGATRRTVLFTSADGTVLKQLDGKSYDPRYQGAEHVLADAKPAPAPGTVVAMYVTLGTTPPTAGASAEFFVLYRCDAKGNEEGGTNAQLQACFGDLGACPTTAAAALASTNGNVPSTANPPAPGAASTPGVPPSTVNSPAPGPTTLGQPANQSGGNAAGGAARPVPGVADQPRASNPASTPSPLASTPSAPPTGDPVAAGASSNGGTPTEATASGGGRAAGLLLMALVVVLAGLTTAFTMRRRRHPARSGGHAPGLQGERSPDDAAESDIQERADDRSAAVAP